jgi:3-oxoacyl-[acyl-carrier protein] reductase
LDAQSLVLAGLRRGRGRETATARLIAQRSQVRILSPLLRQWSLTTGNGRQFKLALERHGRDVAEGRIYATQWAIIADAAVITGGAQGIGLAIARRFAENGARIVIGDLDEGKAKEAAAALNIDAIGVGCDVASEADVTALLGATTAAFGSVDIMVNNAGITRDATMRKMTEQQFDDVITVHLRGCWNGTRLAAGIMRDNGGGSIINMSSISGKVGFIGQTNYSAAKAGIVGLSKAAAKEVAHLGVRVNVIQPGLIRTAMTEAMPAHVWEQKLAEVPMGRAGEPDEIASVALFYASDLSSYMTGTVAEVTGGRYM